MKKIVATSALAITLKERNKILNFSKTKYLPISGHILHDKVAHCIKIHCIKIQKFGASSGVLFCFYDKNGIVQKKISTEEKEQTKTI